MVEFKAKADAIIKERWGIDVEHVCAMKGGEKITYEKLFYHVPKRKPGGKFSEISIAGFPYRKGAWCNDRLKTNVLDDIAKSAPKRAALRESGAKKGTVQYIGIAADEPNRFHNLTDVKKSPLVELGWTEAVCREWCEANDLLSPIYTTATRGGCWFCHNQSIQQLRLLRKNYPEYWDLMLKWDSDSPVTFHADGHTVHDFDERFRLEDEGFISAADRFYWSMLDASLNYSLWEMLDTKNGNSRN